MTNQTWLTEEAAERLRAELNDLEGPRFSDIVKKIEAARAEGDLKENGGYHAAREEQGKIVGRIRQVKHMLDNALIGTPPESESGVVGLGMVVKIDMAGDEITFLLGSREIANGEIEVYSEKSPLGSAILGAKIGEQVNYQTPSKKIFVVTILEASPYS